MEFRANKKQILETNNKTVERKQYFMQIFCCCCFFSFILCLPQLIFYRERNGATVVYESREDIFYHVDICEIFASRWLRIQKRSVHFTRWIRVSKMLLVPTNTAMKS